MKTYFINKNNDAKVEMTIKANDNGERFWCSKPNNMPQCKVGEVPEHIEVVYDTQDDNERIGGAIKNIRTSQGLSMRGLEAISGVLAQNMAKMERGEVNLTIETISRLITPLGYKLAIIPVEV